MFYRRKVILAFLELFEGSLEKIRLQKILFLFSQSQGKECVYDFVPYKFGCYSFSASADLVTMVTKGLLTETESHFFAKEKTTYFKQLKVNDQNKVLEIKKLYGGMSSFGLMKHTYLNFPYWATKSIKAKEILTENEYAKVESFRTFENKNVLFTIGYEGISLEEYLNRLVREDVKLLVDVRNNPLSMKYGFSKSQLKRFCENLGIAYLHFPEVGIQSDQRQELNTQSDYDVLFEDYKLKNLTKTQKTQLEILNLLKKYQRIALTCFEANICQCHRKPLAEAITALPGFEYELKHI
ncbi:MAG: DUF488 domain-containing protein [Leadbetterella sp.]|nr:DUF488 domain-containing protein [Leadbetterella sp.]